MARDLQPKCFLWFAVSIMLNGKSLQVWSHKHGTIETMGRGCVVRTEERQHTQVRTQEIKAMDHVRVIGQLTDRGQVSNYCHRHQCVCDYTAITTAHKGRARDKSVKGLRRAPIMYGGCSDT